MCVQDRLGQYPTSQGPREGLAKAASTWLSRRAEVETAVPWVATCHQEGTPSAGRLRELAAGPALAPRGCCPAGPEGLFWKVVRPGARLWHLHFRDQTCWSCSKPQRGFRWRTEHCPGGWTPQNPQRQLREDEGEGGAQGHLAPPLRHSPRRGAPAPLACGSAFYLR